MTLLHLYEQIRYLYDVLCHVTCTIIPGSTCIILDDWLLVCFPCGLYSLFILISLSLLLFIVTMVSVHVYTLVYKLFSHFFNGLWLYWYDLEEQLLFSLCLFDPFHNTSLVTSQSHYYDHIWEDFYLQSFARWL